MNPEPVPFGTSVTLREKKSRCSAVVVMKQTDGAADSNSLIVASSCCESRLGKVTFRPLLSFVDDLFASAVSVYAADEFSCCWLY